MVHYSVFLLHKRRAQVNILVEVRREISRFLDKITSNFMLKGTLAYSEHILNSSHFYDTVYPVLPKQIKMAAKNRK